MGKRKPTLGFYRHVLKASATDANNAIYIDDDPQNILAAQSLGIHGIVYKTFPELVSSMKSFFRDPVVMGNRWLQKNAGRLHSFLDSGMPVVENYVQLEIWEVTGDEYG